MRSAEEIVREIEHRVKSIESAMRKETQLATVALAMTGALLDLKEWIESDTGEEHAD
jgi:hypothetical protein